MKKLEFVPTVITPDVAKDLISKNIWNNRVLNQNNLHFLINQMSKGLWIPDTGENIKITDTGKVIDGNHRLHAIIKTGITIETYIAYGVPEPAIMVIDTGAKRTIANALTILGVPNSQIIASTIQMYTNLKNGLIGTLSSPASHFDKGGAAYSGYGYSKKQISRLSSFQIFEIYKEREILWDEFATKFLTKCRIIDTSSNIAAMWAYLHDYSESGANEFIHGLVTGENLENDSPILILRNRFIQAKTSKIYALTQVERYMAYIICWNKFRKNQQMKVLRIDLTKQIKPLK